MNAPIAHPPVTSASYSAHFRVPSVNPKAILPSRHAFREVATVDTLAAPCPVDMDGSDLSEPWETVEIDEAAPVSIGCAIRHRADLLTGRRIVKPYRTMMATFRARRQALA